MLQMMTRSSMLQPIGCTLYVQDLPTSPRALGVCKLSAPCGGHCALTTATEYLSARPSVTMLRTF